jgi:hypothetical protein
MSAATSKHATTEELLKAYAVRLEVIVLVVQKELYNFEAYINLL